MCAFLDDKTLVFDSFNIDLETNLLNEFSLAFGLVSPDFVMSDTFVIPFNRLNTQLLYQDAKGQCFLEFRQVENPKAERRARGLLISSQKASDKEQEFYNYGGPFDTLPHYGRKR